MSFDPISKTMTAVGRTLLAQSSQANMRVTGLGVDAEIDPFLTAANIAAGLTALGFSAFVQGLIDDSDSATFLASISALGLMTHVQKTHADTPYTVLGANYFVECNITEVMTVTLPALAGLNAGDRIAVGLVSTSSDVMTVDANAAELINGSANDTMDVAGQIRVYEVNADKSGWIIT